MLNMESVPKDFQASIFVLLNNYMCTHNSGGTFTFDVYVSQGIGPHSLVVRRS